MICIIHWTLYIKIIISSPIILLINYRLYNVYVYIYWMTLVDKFDNLKKCACVRSSFLVWDKNGLNFKNCSYKTYYTTRQLMCNSHSHNLYNKLRIYISNNLFLTDSLIIQRIAQNTPSLCIILGVLPIGKLRSVSRLMKYKGKEEDSWYRDLAR